MKGSRLILAFGVLLLLAGCTASSTPEPSPAGGASASQPSATSQAGIVPDLVGENFLEAIGMIDPPLRMRERYIETADWVNGTILEQDPPSGTAFDPEGPEFLIRVVVSQVPA